MRLPSLPGEVVDFGERSLRRFLPGASVSAVLGALLGAAAFIVVVGAVIGGVASERTGERLAAARASG